MFRKIQDKNKDQIGSGSLNQMNSIKKKKSVRHRHGLAYKQWTHMIFDQIGEVRRK